MTKPPFTNENADLSQQFDGLPLEDLIGGPLSAADAAQRQLGMEMVRFVELLSFGNEGRGEEAGGEPVPILPFAFERPVVHDDGRVTTNKITVESLVPAVGDARYKTRIAVSGKTSPEQTEDDTVTFDVTVHATQHTPPDHVRALLDLMAQTIEPVDPQDT